MKVSRQNIDESYSTTVDWVAEFERDILKSANFLETLRGRYYSGGGFNTIEEKMADIKDRVGFGLIKAEREGADITVSASDDGALEDDKRSSRHVDLVNKMLSYIRSMSENEHHLPATVVVKKCIDDFGGSESLASDGLSLDMDKLALYADAISSKTRIKNEDSGSAKYVAPDPEGSDGSDPAEFSNRVSS